MDEEKVYCSMYSRNAELYHHGIKGQKWGVQNGPPYPLDSSISTGSKLKEKLNFKSDQEAYDHLKKRLDYEEEHDVGNLWHEIVDSIGDWYNREPKTYRLKEAVKKYEKEYEKLGGHKAYMESKRGSLLRKKFNKIGEEYENAWVEEALKSLGYPITEDLKDLIYPVVIWD